MVPPSKGGDGPATKRRDLMLALGTGTLAAFAGCLGDDDGDGEPEATPTPDESLEMGGHLRVTGMAQPITLHPMEGTSLGDYIMMEMMYDRLTAIDRETLEAVPQLATDWEANEDADEFVFDIREGVTFSNIDHELLAEDIQATAEVLASDDVLPGADIDLYTLDQIEIEDDYRVRFHLERSDIAYPKRLAETGNWFNIVPKTVIDDESRWNELSSVDYGSGPWELTDFEEGDEYNFTANEDYFGEDADGNSYPYTDELTVNIVPDTVAQIDALLDERADVVNTLHPEQRPRVDSEESIVQQEFSTTAFLSVVLNTTLELESGDRPFADPKVRKAMKHALDREEIQFAVDNTIDIGHHDPVAPIHELYGDFDEGLEFGTTAQVDEAQALMEEAGYGDGLELPTPIYETEIDARRGTAMQLFQEQMLEIGIEFDIRLVTPNTWLTDYWNQEGVWYASGYAARMEDTAVHELALHSDAAWNSAKWSNDDYDEAYENFSSATDPDVFEEQFHEAQRIHHLEGGWIVFGHSNQFAAYNDYVGHYDGAPASDRDSTYDAALTSDAPEGP